MPQYTATLIFQTNICGNMIMLSAIPFIFFFILFCFSFLLLNRKPKLNLPPSPRRFPVIGNLHQLGSLPHRSLRELSNKHGPLMLLHLGRVPTLVVSSSEMAHEVLKTHDLVFASRPHSSVADVLMYGCDIAFSPYGEYWRKARKICVLHLLNSKVIGSLKSLREEEVSLMIEKIQKSRQGAVNVSELFFEFSSNLICRVALGRRYSDGGTCKGPKLLLEMGQLLGSFPVGDFIPWLAWLDRLSGLKRRLRKNFEEVDGFLEGVLSEHLHEEKLDKKGPDFVDILLDTNKEENSTAGISLSRDNMKAIILDMFAGGTDTIVTTLEWAMAEIMGNLKILKRTQDEVRRIVRNNVMISEVEIGQMRYLKAVIKETLRLHPPVPLLVPRETTQDIQLKGYHVAAGTRVIINGWAIGRDPQNWEKPDEFWPDRFINRDIDFKGQDFQFIPFGGGRRGCPGDGFALRAIEIVLANLLHRFNWEVPKGMEEEVMDMTSLFGITNHKKSSMVLIAKDFFA